MKIVVDTNLVFSTILNTNSTVGNLLLNSDDVFEFITVTYLKAEIEKHINKLEKISGLSRAEITELRDIVFSKLSFTEEKEIPFEFWKKSAFYVRDVDMNDIAFVALTLYNDSNLLWTGDKKLIQGLSEKGFNKIISVEKLIDLRKTLKAE